MSKLKKDLSNLPCLKPIRSDNGLAYHIKSENGIEPVIYFSSDMIKLDYKFDRPSPEIYALNLQRILAVLAYLNDLYVPEIGSLYPYIMESLATQAQKVEDGGTDSNDLLARRIESLGEMNASLSLQLLLLKEKTLKAEESCKILKEFSRRVIDNSRPVNNGRRFGEKPNPKILGVEQELASKAYNLAFDKKNDKKEII
jgi:hypothetical protein